MRTRVEPRVGCMTRSNEETTDGNERWVYSAVPRCTAPISGPSNGLKNVNAYHNS